MRRIIVIGAGGHAVSLAETIRAAGFEISSFVDERALQPGTFLGVPLLTELPVPETGEQAYAVAIGDNFTREQATAKLLNANPLAELPTLIHPSASIAASATVGAGAAVLQGAIVGSHATVEAGALINSGAIVEHECQVGAFASLGPGAKLGGRTTIGHRSAVSIGATVKHGVTVESDTVVGAASYVHRDLQARVVAFGVPATVRQRREPSDAYLL